MATAYKVPLTPPCQFSLNTPLGVFKYRVIWKDVPSGFSDDDIQEAGWIIDVMDSTGVLLIAGVPMLPGQNLFAQDAYLGIPSMWIVNQDFPDDAPTFANLGVTTNLYYSL